jgi:hypothetical protein
MRKLIIISLFIFGLCIFIAPRLPFMDYPDWIYQGNIFHGFLSSDPLFISQFMIVSPFVPNSLVTVLIGVLAFVVSPDLAGRILVFISALIMFLGLKELYGNKNNLLAESLALIFMPAVFLFMGLISFYLGLGLFLMFVTQLKPSRKRGITFLKYTISLLILYYIHFLPFFLFSLWLLMKSLFFRDENTPHFIELIPGFLLTSVLTLLYIHSASSSPSGSTILTFNVLGKVAGFFNSLSIFYEFNDLSSLPVLTVIIALNLIWMISFILLIACWIRGRLRKVTKSPKFVFGAVCLIIGTAMPLLINGFGYNSELRFYWIGLMFIAGATLGASNIKSNKAAYLIAFLALFTISWRSIILVTKGIEGRKFEATVSSIMPYNESFQLVMVPYSLPEYYPFRPGIQRKMAALCQHVSEINRMPLYLYLDRHEVYRGIFKTGIIRSKYPPCDIKALLDGSSSYAGDDCSKFLFICPRGFTEPFRAILAKRFSIINEGPNFILASPISAQPAVDESSTGNVNE